MIIKNKQVKHTLRNGINTPRRGIKEISHCAFFPRNRKGAEKIISIYWFAILIIIAGAVVAMVSLFYGTPYDVRSAEANIMINQVSNCLSENGKLNQKLFSEDKTFNENFNLKEECSLIFETEFENSIGEYFLEAD